MIFIASIFISIIFFVWPKKSPKLVPVIYAVIIMIWTLVLIRYGSFIVDGIKYWINSKSNQMDEFSEEIITNDETGLGNIGTENDIDDGATVYITPKCISVYAMDVNDDYVAVRYSDADVSKGHFYLENMDRQYDLSLKNGILVAENVPNGNYTISTDGNTGYYFHKDSLEVGQEGDLEYELRMIFADDSKYEDFSESFEKYINEEFMFADEEGNNTNPYNSFQFTDKGTVFLKVAWELPQHDVRIKLLSGNYIIFEVDQRYNGATWIKSSIG